jgi:hypothetical protein
MCERQSRCGSAQSKSQFTEFTAQISVLYACGSGRHGGAEQGTALVLSA